MIADHSDPSAEIGSKESGGQNVYVFYLTNFLAQHGVEIDVYTRWDKKNKKEIIQLNNHPLIRVIRVKAGPRDYMPRDNFLNVIDEFTENILKKVQELGVTYDVIHSNYWYSGLAGLKIAKKLGIPMAHTYHSLGFDRFETLKARKLDKTQEAFFQYRIAHEKRIAEECNSVIATSPIERENIKREFGIPEEKIKVIPIGVDLEIFHPLETKRARRNIGFADRGELVLYVGRLEWRKGIETLIHAVRALIDEHPDLKLYIVGGGRTKASISLESEELRQNMDLIKKLHLEENIEFIGPRQQIELYQYYSAADIAVVPSYYEPFGITPLEAMACGTPVVASLTGGLQFTVHHGVTGYLAEPQNASDLAEKINMVLKRGKKSFTTNCLQRIHDNFEWDGISQEYITHFQRLIEDSAIN